MFDVSGTVAFLDIDGRRIVSRREEPLVADPALKVARIAAEGVDAFLCGAVSRPYAQMLMDRGVRLHAFLAGDVEELVQAFLDGRLDQPRYSMPGCRGRRADGACSRGPCRGRRGRNA